MTDLIEHAGRRPCRPSGRRAREGPSCRSGDAWPASWASAGRDRGYRRGARRRRSRRGGAAGHLGVDRGAPVVAYACHHRVGGITEVHAQGGRRGDRRLPLHLGDPHITQNSYVISSQFEPGSPEVHHAVLALVSVHDRSPPSPPMWRPVARDGRLRRASAARCVARRVHEHSLPERGRLGTRRAPQGYGGSRCPRGVW